MVVQRKTRKKVPKKTVRKPVQTTSSIFETSPSIVGGDFEDQIILLYGAVKIGKTKFCEHLPHVYFFPTEPGYKNRNIRKTDLTRMDLLPPALASEWRTMRKDEQYNEGLLWANFRYAVDEAMKKPKELKDIRMFVVDTATLLSKGCMNYYCAREGIDHPADYDWGKGWEGYGNEFMRVILRLASLGKGIVFVGHQDTREVMHNRMKVPKHVPDLPKTTYRIVNEMADIILHMSYVESGHDTEALGKMRCLYTKPSEIRDAGDRTEKLPAEIPFKTETEAVRKILSCFKGD